MTANDIITLPSLSSTRKMNDMDTFWKPRFLLKAYHTHTQLGTIVQKQRKQMHQIQSTKEKKNLDISTVVGWLVGGFNSIYTRYVYVCVCVIRFDFKKLSSHTHILFDWNVNERTNEWKNQTKNLDGFDSIFLRRSRILTQRINRNTYFVMTTARVYLDIFKYPEPEKHCGHCEESTLLVHIESFNFRLCIKKLDNGQFSIE